MKQSDNDALHVCNGSTAGRAPQLDAVICSGNLAVPGQQRVSVCVCVCMSVPSTGCECMCVCIRVCAPPLALCSPPCRTDEETLLLQEEMRMERPPLGKGTAPT